MKKTVGTALFVSLVFFTCKDTLGFPAEFRAYDDDYSELTNNRGNYRVEDEWHFFNLPFDFRLALRLGYSF
jgi:hypothetical protein